MSWSYCTPVGGASSSAASTTKPKAAAKAEKMEEETDYSKAKRALTTVEPVKAKKIRKPKVDTHVPGYSTFSVVDDWDCMLNQTNIGQNNNKYYVIQLLQRFGWVKEEGEGLREWKGGAVWVIGVGRAVWVIGVCRGCVSDMGGEGLCEWKGVRRGNIEKASISSTTIQELLCVDKVGESRRARTEFHEVHEFSSRCSKRIQKEILR